MAKNSIANIASIALLLKGVMEVRRATKERNEKKLKERARSMADLEALQSLYEITLETRNFEISQLVQRNNFFMIFQGVVFAGVIQSSHTKPLVSFLVCLAGFLVSLLQVGMAAGAKYWQDAWQQQLLEIETKLKKAIMESGLRSDPLEMFTIASETIRGKVQSQLRTDSIINSLISRKYSVSRIPIYIALSLTAIWLVLLLGTMKFMFSLSSFIVGF